MTRPRGTKATVCTGAPNLRGAEVRFLLGRWAYYGRVITHIRSDRWSIQADDLPDHYARQHDKRKRITLHRTEFTVVKPAEDSE